MSGEEPADSSRLTTIGPLSLSSTPKVLGPSIPRPLAPVHLVRADLSDPEALQGAMEEVRKVTGRPEQSQQRDGKSIEQPQAVAPVGRAAGSAQPVCGAR